MGRSKGENTKVTAAKERKAAAKEEKDSKERAKKEAVEDEYWNQGAKKANKNEEKKAKELAKKAELDKLKREEEAEIAKIKPKKVIKEDKKVAKKENKINNFASGTTKGVELQASNIDDALDLFVAVDDSADSTNKKASGIELHPERRAKAAYAVFEARRLPELKEEHKGLRLTQLKERIWKEWQKSEENPFNQATLAYNASKIEKKELVEDTRRKIEDRLKI